MVNGGPQHDERVTLQDEEYQRLTREAMAYHQLLAKLRYPGEELLADVTRRAARWLVTNAGYEPNLAAALFHGRDATRAVLAVLTEEVR